jgi:TRAP-type C4-dicarboxylate transport system permease small subunit
VTRLGSRQDRIVEKIQKALERVLQVASITLFALLVVIVVWQVASRLLGAPATWTEEAARMTFVWVGFFAAALVFSERGHIAVDFLARLLPNVGQRIVATYVEVVIIAFAGIGLVWGGSRAVAGAWGQGLGSLPFTLGQMYLVMPIVGVIIILFALLNIIGIVRGTKEAYPKLTVESAEVV